MLLYSIMNCITIFSSILHTTSKNIQNPSLYPNLSGTALNNLGLHLDASKASSLTLTGTLGTSISNWADTLGVYNFGITNGVLNDPSQGYPLYQSSQYRVYFPYGFYRYVQSGTNTPGYLSCKTALAGTPLNNISNSTGATFYIVIQNDYTNDIANLNNTNLQRSPFNFTGSGSVGGWAMLYGYVAGDTINEVLLNTLQTNPTIRSNFFAVNSTSTPVLNKKHICKINATAFNTFIYSYITSNVTFTSTYANGNIGGFDPNFMTLGASNQDIYRGYMYEILMFDVAISTAQQTIVETYLINKWSL